MQRVQGLGFRVWFEVVLSRFISTLAKISMYLAFLINLLYLSLLMNLQVHLSLNPGPAWLMSPRCCKELASLRWEVQQKQRRV